MQFLASSNRFADKFAEPKRAGWKQNSVYFQTKSTLQAEWPLSRLPPIACCSASNLADQDLANESEYLDYSFESSIFFDVQVDNGFPQLCLLFCSHGAAPQLQFMKRISIFPPRHQALIERIQLGRGWWMGEMSRGTGDWLKIRESNNGQLSGRMWRNCESICQCWYFVSVVVVNGAFPGDGNRAVFQKAAETLPWSDYHISPGAVAARNWNYKVRKCPMVFVYRDEFALPPRPIALGWWGVFEGFRVGIGRYGILKLHVKWGNVLIDQLWNRLTNGGNYWSFKVWVVKLIETEFESRYGVCVQLFFKCELALSWLVGPGHTRNSSLYRSSAMWYQTISEASQR